jgi:CelD/BcsL family acetyltransferase involved in cellulose biosynthesis
MSTVFEDENIDACKSGIPVSNVQLSVKIFSKWEELESLGADWNIILERNRKLTIFSTPEWLGAWWRAFGNDKQLYALAFRDKQGELVGLLPLYLQRIEFRFLPSLSELRLVGDGSTDSDNLDFLVLPRYERAVANSLVQHLATAPCWDICRLNVMPSDSVTANIFLQEITKARWNCETSTVPWTAIELPETWEQYLKQLSPKERGKVGNLTRRLEKRYRMQFYKCNSRKELPACLENLFRLHQKRWESRGESGTFASSARRQFYYDMAQRFLSRDWLALWVLELDGIAVAAQFGFRYRDTVCSLQEGFDPAYSNDSVGYVLRSFSLHDLIELGVRRYEFLAGQNKSKLRWTAISGNYLNFHIARPGTRGSLHLSLVRLVKTTKSRVSRFLHPSFVTFFRSIRRKPPLA